MSSVYSLGFRTRPVPNEESDRDSLSSSSTNPSPHLDDDVASTYESSADDTIAPLTPPVPHSLLIDDPFSTDVSKILFESIDQLQKIGTSKELALPQLVIVGKQSAGKSSLLQSLTDIPFPVDGRLCTRFATRIVSKRSAPKDPDVVSASIEPGDVNPFNYREDDVDMGPFTRIVPSMSAEKFENIVQEATDYMGINSPNGPESRNFSSGVLKIELTGPKRSHFGILDVPGVFSSTVRGVTDEEMNGVTRMVTSYMKKPENIIILVGDASDDLSNQSIFKLAETLDVDSSRIVAVFTKCDLSQTPENIVQTVVEGDGIAGKFLRWHVVRNCGPKASPSFNREEAETNLFNQDPWLEIPEQQRGTPNLKRYLGDLLCKRIREGFPALQENVRDKLGQQEARLKSLGNARENFAQQQAYLRDIVKTYEDLAAKALRSPAELACDEIKLRGFTQNMNAEFAKLMGKEGHKYQFLDIGQEVEADWSREEYDSEPASQRIGDLQRMSNSPMTSQAYPRRNRRPMAAAGLASSPSRQATPQTRTVSPLYNEIQKQIEANRGEELPGMLNPAVLKPLWVKQTSKWRQLGEAHLKKLVQEATYVAIKILSEATKDIELTERTRHKLERKISEDGVRARINVLRQLEVLYHNNATQALQTNNPQFEKKVNQARSKRFRGALERYRNANPPTSFFSQLSKDSMTTNDFDIYGKWTIVDDGYITKLFNEIHPYGERAQNTQDEIHDLLKAYYDIALQNFVHDIEFGIVEPFLQSKDGPLLGLSTDYILSLSEADVEEFGGEDKSVVEQRKDATYKIEKLKQALEIAEDACRKTRELEKVGS